MEAYTYLLVHIPTGKFYYGCRKSKTYDLWQAYFTSSKLVKRMLKEDGIQAFRHEIREIFDSYAEARAWECKVLQRIDAPNNSRCLNQAISAPRICSKDPVAEKRRREGISKAMQIRWQDNEYRETWRTAEMRARFSRMAKNRIRSRNPKKSKTSDQFSLVTINRNNVQKYIRRNQLSAYKKLGWEIGECAETRTQAMQ